MYLCCFILVKKSIGKVEIYPGKKEGELSYGICFMAPEFSVFFLREKKWDNERSDTKYHRNYLAAHCSNTRKNQ